MRKSLVDLLVEPGTLAPLRLLAHATKQDQIWEGDLISTLTGRTYPIVRGIPRFVQSESYTGSFGKQWNAFRATQLDSANSGNYSRRRFDAEAGWSRDELSGRLLLDAGCGAGRFAEIAAERGAHVVALDFSSAVEAASETLARFPNADVVQGDLLSPPFRPGTFDFAYCIGVAQHTPSPKGAVQSVVRCVRPKGHFSLTIYARRLYTKLNAKYLIRPLTKRLPQDLLLSAIERAMPVLFPLTERLFAMPMVGKLARFCIPVACYPERTEFSARERYQESILDTFDMLAPRFDSPMTWQEVEGVLRKNGVDSFHFRTKVPINVVGNR